MKYLTLSLALLLTGCSLNKNFLENDAFRGTLAGVVYGPAGVNHLNDGRSINDGSLRASFPMFIHGSAAIMAFVASPIIGGIYLGLNAFYGGFETHYYFKRKEQKQ